MIFTFSLVQKTELLTTSDQSDVQKHRLLDYLQNPDGLTTSGQLNGDNRIKFKNKHLTPARDGQFYPTHKDQGHWLLQ